jgi:hypothetical protein
MYHPSGSETRSMIDPAGRAMNDQEPPHCPRCGTTLVAGRPFCPKCGLKNNPDGQGSTSAPGDPDARPVGAAIATAPRPLDRALAGNPKLWSALIVVAALVLFDLLTRALGGGAPVAAPGGGAAPGSSAAAPSALIVGLTIMSPQDGQAVATKDVTVIGVAPPGLTITRDISLGLDQHATTDGTGHWAINVSLDNGENKLVFRIGDDHSTEHSIRVIYTPPAQ